MIIQCLQNVLWLNPRLVCVAISISSHRLLPRKNYQASLGSKVLQKNVLTILEMSQKTFLYENPTRRQLQKFLAYSPRKKKSYGKNVGEKIIAKVWLKFGLCLSMDKLFLNCGYRAWATIFTEFLTPVIFPAYRNPCTIRIFHYY